MHLPNICFGRQIISGVNMAALTLQCSLQAASEYSKITVKWGLKCKIT
jgi:hypothetical protein